MKQIAKHNAKQSRLKQSRWWLWGLLLVLLLGAAAFTALRLTDRTVAAYPVEISVAQAAEKRQAGAFILDVRQPEEWPDFHIPGATLIPLGELEARVNDVPRDQEVVVVCRSGNRSATGRDVLRSAGFDQVTSMAGGMTEWKAAGYPTVSGP